MTTQEFIDSIAGYIKEYAAAYNVCVFSPIIAQAILESNKGTSELAVNAHNYFGLKYRKGRCKTCVRARCFAWRFSSAIFSHPIFTFCWFYYIL